MEKIKKFSCVTIAVVVLVSIVCIPALAYTDTSLNGIDFEDQPIPTADPTGLSNEEKYDAGFDVVSYTSSNRLNELSYFSTSNENVYVFGWKQSASEYRFILASTAAFDYVKAEKQTTSSGTVSFLAGKASTASYNENENLYVMSTQMTVSAGYNPTFNIPIFETRNAGVAALKDWIENPPVSTTPHQINYSIPAGYVAFFDIHGLSNIRGSVKAFSAVALTPQQWASTNVLYGYTSSIPSSFNLPLTGSTSYSWNAGKTNIFGKSQNWSWLGVYSGNSNYLFISNPTYSNVTGVMDNGQSMIVDNPSATNSYVDVFLDQAYSVKLVSLNAVITYDPQNGNYGGIDDGNGDTTYDVEYNNESQQWVTTDQNGTPVGPEGIPIGGDNSIDTPSEFGNIAAWLENIAHQISAFFTGAIGAVTTLVNAGSAFIHQLISLYSWLPAPVYAVLSSALILVITIGVIKVFI